MRCRVCSNPQVKEVDTLLETGSSLRKVSKIVGIPRSTLARHKQHLQVSGLKLGLIRGGGGPDRPGDPLEEALLLAGRARTPRESLRALEQVRAATKLKLHGAGDPDQERLALLDENIRQAEAAYKNASDFETAVRALSGWREALRQRLEAVRAPGVIEVPITVTLSDGTPVPGEQTGSWCVTPEQYFRGVPQRYRDPDRFIVRRRVELRWLGGSSKQELKVYEIETGALVWAKEEQ